MSRYLTDLDVRLLSDKEGGGGSWMLMSPLLYESDVADKIIKVPTAFETDFASVPRVPIVFDLMGDLAHAAAALHDYLYTTGEVPREVADAVLKEAAIVSGVPKWKAWAMYFAVRIFGQSHYQK
jgi:hypothetical protein